MADKQYDVSPEFKKLFERKQKQRMEFREYYLKHSTNPYRHASGLGGVVFDPAVHRLHAMHEYANEFWRPNKFQVKFLLMTCIIPFTIMWGAFTLERGYKEEQYRTGKVAPQHRYWRQLL